MRCFSSWRTLDIGTRTVISIPDLLTDDTEVENPISKSDVKIEAQTEQEQHTENHNAISMETSTEEEILEKPRIVLTFVKPGTNEPSKLNESGVLGRRLLRPKVNPSEGCESMKRSSRRRSRDHNESVLQSAIFRKEQSYNDSNKSQRPTRQLKPTPKILENLANAAALKGERYKSDRKALKQKHFESGDFDNENTDESETDVEQGRRRHAQRDFRGSKRFRSESDSDVLESRDGDSDASKSSSPSSKSGFLGSACRRSHRISSK